jgi:CheY-like chemotaxis protein
VIRFVLKSRAKRAFHGQLTAMKIKILAAVLPSQVERYRAILGTEDETTFVFTYKEAKSQVENGTFDLIFCAAHFDESRLIDFIKLVKSNEQNNHAPLIITRINPKKLPPGISMSINMATQELGAHTYIDFINLEQQLSPEEADGYVRGLVKDLLKTVEAQQ